MKNKLDKAADCDSNLRGIIKTIINNNVISDEDAIKKVISKLENEIRKEIFDIPKMSVDSSEVYSFLQKYDIIRTLIGSTLHYAVVINKDVDFNVLWVVPITSDSTLGLTVSIKESRLFRNSYYYCYLQPVPFNSKIQYCGVIDNKAEFINVYKVIINYYRACFKKS